MIKFKWTPLTVAAGLNCSVGICKWLVDHGADVNAEDNRSNRPLHFARDPRVIRLLANSGADVNAQNGNGKTALHLACVKQTPTVAMLQIGVSPRIRDKAGQTAYDLAKERGLKEELLYFLSMDVDSIVALLSVKSVPRLTEHSKPPISWLSADLIRSIVHTGGFKITTPQTN